MSAEESTRSGTKESVRSNSWYSDWSSWTAPCREAIAWTPTASWLKDGGTSLVEDRETT